MSGIRKKIHEALVKAAPEGLSVEQLMKSAGGGSYNAVYSHIYRLREKGVKIAQVDGLYFLGRSKKGSVDSNHKAQPKKSHRAAPKYATVYKILEAAGSEGTDKRALAKDISVEYKNLVYHIHILRKQGCKIELHGDRYYLKGKGPQTLSFKQLFYPETVPDDSKPVPESDVPASLVTKLRALNAAQLDTYLDLFQKATFYEKCTKALLEVNQHINNIKKEVENEG